MIYTMLVTLEVVADSEHNAYVIMRKIMKRGNGEACGVRYLDAECTEHTDPSEPTEPPNLGVYGRGIDR